MLLENDRRAAEVSAANIVCTHGQQTREANAEMYSVYDDVELLDWLRWAHETGPSFLQTIAEAAFLTDLEDYKLLRPALLKLKEANPKTGQDVCPFCC